MRCNRKIRPSDFRKRKRLRVAENASSYSKMTHFFISIQRSAFPTVCDSSCILYVAAERSGAAPFIWNSFQLIEILDTTMSFPHHSYLRNGFNHISKPRNVLLSAIDPPETGNCLSKSAERAIKENCKLNRQNAKNCHPFPRSWFQPFIESVLRFGFDLDWILQATLKRHLSMR